MTAVLTTSTNTTSSRFFVSFPSPAPMSTLADALLDDLDDLSDHVEDEEQGDGVGDAEEEGGAGTNSNDQTYDGVGGGGNDPLANRSPSAVVSSSSTSHRRPHHQLLNDPSLLHHLRAIRETTIARNGAAASATTSTGDSSSSSSSSSYALIVESNRQLARFSEEVVRAHSHLAAAYRPRFPELEEIVAHPEHYLRVVQVIDPPSPSTDGATKMEEAANDDRGDHDGFDRASALSASGGTVLDLARHNDALNEFLTPHQVLTLSVSASSTSGRLLTPQENDRVAEAATYQRKVLAARSEIQQFVASRLSVLAPNGCALVGSEIMAQLIGLAGGSLDELSKVPSCNLQILGQNHQGPPQHPPSSSSQNRLPALSRRAHEGVLASCELVRQLPRALQHKALKVVAAKLALAIRCDLVASTKGGGNSSNSSTNQHGRAFHQQCLDTFHKWQEPDRAPVLKALPKPDLSIKKRRGGKRVRRMKEKYEETAIMKQANTRAFSSATGEYGDDAMGVTRGLLDSAEVVGGPLRRNLEKKQVRVANTKASRKRAAQLAASALPMAGSTSSAATSGLATSIVFTPSQGMELVNPNAQRERVADANQRWFGDQAGFRSALPKR